MSGLTAVIAYCGERGLIEACLSSLGFCDRLIVVDMSDDAQLASALEAHGAERVAHARVDVVEDLHAEFLPTVQSDFILLVDPDEVVSSELRTCLLQMLEELKENPHIGAVRVPWQFYFAGHTLKGTVWGGRRRAKVILYCKAAMILQKRVHDGIRLRDGFGMADIERERDNYLQHYWMTGYREWWEKHMRYLRREGEFRHASGHPFNWLLLPLRPLYAFFVCYVFRLGFLDGARGFVLSLFWAFYDTRAYFALGRARAAG
ncbi:MAG: glycosyltransferase family protein [Planctomycetota bacterium]|jgi:hypothetical protein